MYCMARGITIWILRGNFQITRAEIEETKQELVEAKLVRKNRMEYDALAKVKILIAIADVKKGHFFRA